MTILTKEIIRRFIPGSAGHEGFPGQPYIPAHVSLRPYQVCGYTYLTPSEIQAAYLAAGVTIIFGPNGPQYVFPPGVNSTSIPTSVYRCTTYYEPVNVPEQSYLPPIPAAAGYPGKTQEEFQLGWNSRAHSVLPMLGHGAFSFKVTKDSVGIVVGLTPTPAASGFSDIAWGFYVSKGVVRIYESGSEISYHGAQPDADLKIERSGGNIIYSIDGTVVRTTPNSSVPMYLGAALYSGGDTVYDGLLTNYAQGSGVMQPLNGYGGDDGYAFGIGVMLPMNGSGSAYRRAQGIGVMEPLAGYGSDSSGYAIGIGVMEPMRGVGEAYALAPDYAIGSGRINVFIGQGLGTTGKLAQGSGVMEPMKGLGADYAYAFGSGSIEPLRGYGENFLPGDEAVMVSFMLTSDYQNGQQLLAVVMNSNIEVTGLILVEQLEMAIMSSLVTGESSAVTEQELFAEIMSLMRAITPDGDSLGASTIWAMNVDLAESTRYTNYGFNSFAKVGGSYYGAKSDGIYLLNGRDDGDDDVEALVNFGNMAFGMLERKSLPHVYAGVASDGRLLLKVTAEGQTYYYQARGQSTDLKTHRFDLGRGLKATHYEIELMNDGGSLFDLSTIEFQPVKLSRRL